MIVRILASLALVATLAVDAAEILIRNATVHTVAATGTLRDADVLIRDGRIAAIGPALPVAPDGEVFDAEGAPLTPGLFDAYTRFGLEEIDGVEETGDQASKDARFGASMDVTDALNPHSAVVAVNRSEGVTRALSAPEPGDRAGLFAGLGAVVNLGAIEDFATRPRAAMFAPAGELAARLIGGSRAAAFALLRESFEETRNPKRWMGRPNREPLLSPLEAAALKPVLAGQVPLVVSVDRAADIRALLRLSAEYRFRPVILGGAEAHLLATELAASEVPVILNPVENLPDRFETLNARLDNAARLQAAGVIIAISDGDTHNARNIRQLAGNAVAHGLPWDAALAAITRNPARIYGVEQAVGSIEVGKAADLVLWDGDPLEVTSFARQVLIDGRAIPMHNRQTLLRDRYLERMRE